MNEDNPPASSAPEPVEAPSMPAAETTPADNASTTKPSLRLASTSKGGIKPLTNQQIERAVKMPNYASRFTSPMPQLDETDDTPGWHAGLAALAAVVAVGSAVLLFTKI